MQLEPPLLGSGLLLLNTLLTCAADGDSRGKLRASPKREKLPLTQGRSIGHGPIR